MDFLDIMLGVVMFIAVALTLTITVVALLGAPSMFMRSVARNGGPESLWRGGLYASIALSALGAFLGFLGAMVLNVAMSWYSGDLMFEVLMGAAIGASSFFVVEALIAYISAGDIANAIRLQKNIAPAVSQWALARYAEIVNVEGGVIKQEHLQADQDMSPEQLGLLSQLQAYISDIGHVIDTYTTTSIIWTGSVAVPTTQTHYVYGISKADLLSYPGRIASVYSRW